MSEPREPTPEELAHGAFFYGDDGLVFVDRARKKVYRIVDLRFKITPLKGSGDET